MARLTIKAINKEIAPLGYELVHAHGNFYFWPLAGSVAVQLYESSVMVNNINQFSLELWISDLKEKIADTKRRRGEEEEAAGRYPNGYDAYKNKMAYPDKVYQFFIYSKGKVVLDTTDKEEYNKKLQDEFAGAPHEKIWSNEEEYRAQCRAYNEETARLEELFKQDLFKYHGVEDNPKRDECYYKAYERGHHAGFSEIASYFSDLVDLIK